MILEGRKFSILKFITALPGHITYEGFLRVDNRMIFCYGKLSQRDRIDRKCIEITGKFQLFLHLTNPVLRSYISRFAGYFTKLNECCGEIQGTTSKWIRFALRL